MHSGPGYEAPKQTTEVGEEQVGLAGSTYAECKWMGWIQIGIA